MKINFPDELIKQVEALVQEGTYKTVDEFVKAAVETLLIAEKMKDSFTKSIKSE